MSSYLNKRFIRTNTVIIKMVKEIGKNDKKYFQCESCGFYYEDKEIAEKCQAYCDEHHSCSLEITKHAVQI